MNVCNTNESHKIHISAVEVVEDKNNDANVYHFLEQEKSSNLCSDENDSKADYRPLCKKRCLSDSLKVSSDVSKITTEDKVEEKCKRRPQVAYIHSQELLLKANDLIRIEGRAQLVHTLISTYGILQYINIIPPRAAYESEILGFHSADYVKCLQDISAINDCDEVVEHNKNDLEGFGLSYDCPLQKDLFETASLISGASLIAAQQLLDGTADIAINWYGGWHHAKRDTASGFCYLNDVVLCILKLREKFDKVLYVDIDLHHGDGVEEAFSTTCKVMTVSFHKLSPGFFPVNGCCEGLNTEGWRPIDFFCLYWDLAFWTHLVNDTYSRAAKWKDVTLDEMKCFIGTIFAMGALNLSNMADYWRRTIPLLQTNFGQVMFRDCFFQLWRYLHLANNSRDTSTDRFFKVR